MEQYVRMVSPANVLKRGYTLTIKNGSIVTSLHAIARGDVIETHFRDGIATSEVRGVNSSRERNKLSETS